MFAFKAIIPQPRIILSDFMTMAHQPCELCDAAGGHPIWEDHLCRVVRVPDADYAGFCRVIWREHRSEMSDLSVSERRHLNSVVYALEVALRELYRPIKINLASLGNVVPHLHSHVIPRFEDDRHFPNPIWADAKRPTSPVRPVVSDPDLRSALIAALAAEQSG